jgi:diaminopimelate epimerase
VAIETLWARPAGVDLTCYRPPMSTPLSFFKYEGLGNDFIVVEVGDARDLPSGCATRLCDRHFGIGADGVLLILPARSPESTARMEVINADGSIPEICGNGLRCVAVHLARARGIRGGTVRVETDAGPRSCLLEDAHGEGMVTVDMGAVRVLGDRSVQLDEQERTLTFVDVGNPHAILFGTFTRCDVEQIGPRLAIDSAFPGGTNVEFARVTGDAIELTVWERGVGVTLACGTGACATVAAACAKGFAPRNAPVVVRLPGGDLTVTIDDASRATMRGPARHVFSGTIAESRPQF